MRRTRTIIRDIASKNKTMIKDSKYPLLAKAENGKGIYQSILKEETGWQFLNFQARLMKKGESWKGNTVGNEYGIILLGGNYSVKSDKGDWRPGMEGRMYSVGSLTPCTFQGTLSLN